MTKKCIRITEKEYQKKFDMLKYIKDFSQNELSKSSIAQFYNQNRFPTVEDLIIHDVENNLSKFFEYLMYYHEEELFTSDDPKFQKSKKMIDDIFNKYVIIIYEEDLVNIRKYDKKGWAELSFEQKVDVLEPLSLYFKDNECNEFIRVLSKFDIYEKAGDLKKRELKKIFEYIISKERG